MKNVRALAIAAVLSAFALPLAGCSGAGENQAPQTAAGLSKAPIGANTHGFVKVVGEALGEVPLRPEQRTELEKLAAESEARHASLVTGRKEVTLSLADQIEKGSIDRAALQPKIDRAVADMEKVRPADHAAMVRVHEILDSQQRNAFVDALEQKFKAHLGGHAKGEHAKGGFGHGFAKMKQLADDLQLNDEQRTQIREALKSAHEARAKNGEKPDFREMHKRMQGGKAFLESFRSDKLDPQAIPNADFAKKADAGVTRMIDVAEKVLPILTEPQRKIAADKLREFAAKGADPLAH